MIKEIENGAVFEFHPDNEGQWYFSLVWYAENGDVVYARIVSYDEMNEAMKLVYGTKFEVHWLDGKVETLEGVSKADALRNAGYSADALKAIDFIRELPNA